MHGVESNHIRLYWTNELGSDLFSAGNKNEKLDSCTGTCLRLPNIRYIVLQPIVVVDSTAAAITATAAIAADAVAAILSHLPSKHWYCRCRRNGCHYFGCACSQFVATPLQRCLVFTAVTLIPIVVVIALLLLAIDLDTCFSLLCQFLLIFVCLSVGPSVRRPVWRLFVPGWLGWLTDC